MAKLPDISRDVSLLKRFIRAVEDLPTAPSTALEVAQNHAEILLKRLETPVRIAVTGATGAALASSLSPMCVAVQPSPPRAAATSNAAPSGTHTLGLGLPVGCAASKASANSAALAKTPSERFASALAHTASSSGEAPGTTLLSLGAGVLRIA